MTFRSASTVPAPDAGADVERPVRWTAYRKLELVLTVRSGRLDIREVARRYDLTLDELESWAAAFDAYGLGGLLVTKGQWRRRGRANATQAESRSQRERGVDSLGEPAAVRPGRGR